MACSVISTSQLNQKSGTIVACIQACLFYKKDAAAASFMSLKPFKMSIAESLGDGRPRSSIVKSHSAKVKKDQLSQYLTGQFVLMATNIGLNFAKQKVVVEILNLKESQK